MVGVGSNTAMGSIRDSMLKTEDVRFLFLIRCLLLVSYPKMCLLLDAGGNTTQKEA